MGNVTLFWCHPRHLPPEVVEAGAYSAQTYFMADDFDRLGIDEEGRLWAGDYRNTYRIEPDGPVEFFAFGPSYRPSFSLVVDFRAGVVDRIRVTDTYPAAPNPPQERRSWPWDLLHWAIGGGLSLLGKLLGNRRTRC